MKFGSLGAPTKAATPLDELRQLRLEVARRQAHWTELQETALVARGPFLVHADSDRLYRRTRGSVFEPSSARILTPQLEHAYYVDQADEVVFVEASTNPSTWSEGGRAACRHPGFGRGTVRGDLGDDAGDDVSPPARDGRRGG